MTSHFAYSIFQIISHNFLMRILTLRKRRHEKIEPCGPSPSIMRIRIFPIKSRASIPSYISTFGPIYYTLIIKIFILNLNLYSLLLLLLYLIYICIKIFLLLLLLKPTLLLLLLLLLL